jgi:hypothetical protein
LVHGEDGQRQALAAKLSERLQMEAELPVGGQQVSV